MKTLAATLGLVLAVAVPAGAEPDKPTASEKKPDRADDAATPARTRTPQKKAPAERNDAPVERNAAPAERHEEPVERAPAEDNEAQPKAKTHEPLAPATMGAPTARCRDGELSYSDPQASCVDHGGVAEWLVK
jgi:hypothetical protein